MANLLIDTMPMVLRMEESKDGSKLIVRGQFARSDKATQNKRLYKEHLWKREIGRLNEAMKARRAFGELDHPNDGRTKLQRVSHIMTDLRVEGGEIVGEAEILDTPNGRILKAIFGAGAQVGVSSRGYGSTKTLSDGTEEVQEDFRLDTFDFVADPATQTAYPKVFQEEREHLMEAEKEWTIESIRRDYPGLLREFAEQERGNFAKQLAEAETRTQERLKTKFSQEVRRHIENLEEDAYRKARSELESDPEVAAAKVVLEQIVGLIAPFGMDHKTRENLEAKDAEIQDLQKRLAERELEAQALKKDTESLGSLAQESSYKLHIERALRENPSREAIVTMLGDVTQYKSVKDIDERIGVLVKEFAAVKPKSATREEETQKLTDQIAALEESKKSLEEKLAQSHRERDDAVAKCVKATNLVESLKVKLHTEKLIFGRADADTIRGLCEHAATEEEASRIVENFVPHRRLDADEVERIRARVQRGKEHDQFREVSTSPGKTGVSSGNKGLLESVGLTGPEFDRLAGG